MMEESVYRFSSGFSTGTGAVPPASSPVVVLHVRDRHAEADVVDSHEWPRTGSSMQPRRLVVYWQISCALDRTAGNYAFQMVMT